MGQFINLYSFKDNVKRAETFNSIRIFFFTHIHKIYLFHWQKEGVTNVLIPNGKFMYLLTEKIKGKRELFSQYLLPLVLLPKVSKIIRRKPDL